MEAKQIYIYYLKCPIDGQVKYVGQTADMFVRLAEHITANIGDKADWIKSLRAKKLFPEIIEIEKVPFYEAYEREFYWTMYYAKLGCKLFNAIGIKDTNLVPLTFQIDRSIRTLLDKKCFEDNKTRTEIISQILTDYFTKYKTKWTN